MSAIFISFLSFAIISTFTPGPNNISSTSAGMKLGYKKTLPYLLGIATGFFLLMLLSGFITSFLSDTYLIFTDIFKWIGATYIFWLALLPFLHYNQDKKNKNKKQYSYSFLSGLGLQIVNIKVILYGATIYSAFNLLIRTSDLMIVVSGLFLAFLSFCSISLWAITGATLAGFFKNRMFYFVFNGTLGLMLIYIAVKILIY
jgi:cysteine/O-acetylserine efflux protein